jgi:SAM-dependent methyltransferase
MSSPVLPLDPLAVSGAGADPHALFRRFTTEVARRQLLEWLPREPQVVLDLSRPAPALHATMASRGHTVIHLHLPAAAQDVRPSERKSGGRLWTVAADPRRLDWLADDSVDVIVSEGGALSDAPAAELTLEDLARVLRPGGRMLLCVDSLLSGLSKLADLGQWAALADVPAADVVLVPRADGGVVRCFWPEELHSIFRDVGLEIDWIRPRTVLAEDSVTRALGADPGQLDTLVNTELGLAHRRQGEWVGSQLVVSAGKP